MPDHLYDNPHLSPRAFLYAVMRSSDIPLYVRLSVAQWLLEQGMDIPQSLAEHQERTPPDYIIRIPDMSESLATHEPARLVQ
jgi:hypothetical protein